MQPVTFISEIEQSYGALGYSALVYPLLGGEAERKTLYMLRDADGWTRHILILDAKEAF